MRLIRDRRAVQRFRKSTDLIPILAGAELVIDDVRHEVRAEDAAVVAGIFWRRPRIRKLTGVDPVFTGIGMSGFRWPGLETTTIRATAHESEHDKARDDGRGADVVSHWSGWLSSKEATGPSAA